MKRKKITLGVVGTVLTALLIVISPWKSIKSEGAYTQEGFSSLNERSANDARIWLEARYTIPETGERISGEKLREIDEAIKMLPRYKNASFVEEGPDNFGGRTRAIQIDRLDPNIIWAGGVSGGLFKSEDRASTWSQVAAYEDLNAPFISSMTQLSNGALFVATGSSEEAWSGNGLWYTTDQGSTWTIVPGTDAYNVITEVVSPDNGTTIWFTTPQGLKKWNFGDATLTDVDAGLGACRALKCSRDGLIFIASFSSSRTYVSTDGGNTWEDRTGSQNSGKIPVGAPRIEYAISDNPNSSGLYTLYAIRTSSDLLGMHVSHDSGATWTQFVGEAGEGSNLDIYRNQGTYNSVVSVVPDRPESILIGGIDIWKWDQTTVSPTPPAGGFEKITNWFTAPSSSKYAHSDNHEMKWDGDRIYVGNDGGIGISDNFNISWYPSNRGYNVTQFYGIAFDRNGSVMGGAQDNGTLYNDHTMNTWTEFREVSGGDGINCEISFFNPKIAYSTRQYGVVYRLTENFAASTEIPLPFPADYGVAGSGQGEYPFHTPIFLAEYYDLNSEDSVIYIPQSTIESGTEIKVPSLATGDTILYTTNETLYFDDTVNYDPSLSQQKTSVTNQLNGETVNIDDYGWTAIGSSGSGSNPPLIGDSILVNFPSGMDTVVVGGTNQYTEHYSIHPILGDTLNMGRDTVIYNFAWSRIKVQDPYQSWLLLYTYANGGELWGTRDALRLGETQLEWGIIAQGIGTDIGRDIDVEFSRDLNHCFISTGESTVRRLDGLGGVYSSSSSFAEDAFYNESTPPQGTSISSFSVGVTSEGIALNPNNPDDLIVSSISGAMRRSSNATAPSPSFTSLSPISSSPPPVYDAIIDRDNPNIIVAGTSHGVFVTENGGADWLNASEGFQGTPVYAVRQSWRTRDEGNQRPGEIYVGTYGRGLWRSDSYLSTDGTGSNGGIAANGASFMTNLSVFPNPSVSSSTIRFDLKSNTDVNIAVYNLSGRLVKKIVAKNLSSGTQFIDLESGHLEQGTYILKFQAGTQKETVKFIKR